MTRAKIITLTVLAAATIGGIILGFLSKSKQYMVCDYPEGW